MYSTTQCEKASSRSGKTMNSPGLWYTIWMKSTEGSRSREEAGDKPPRYRSQETPFRTEPVEYCMA